VRAVDPDLDQVEQSILVSNNERSRFKSRAMRPVGPDLDQLKQSILRAVDPDLDRLEQSI